MAPYRTPPAQEQLSERMLPEERVLLWTLLVLGGVRVLIAVVARRRFDVEPTLALIMFCLGGVWGVRRCRSHARRAARAELDELD